jgi:hypothetical protein
MRLHHATSRSAVMLVRMTAAPAGSLPRPDLDGDGLATAGVDDESSSIRVATEGSTVVITVERTLDAQAGDTLVRLAAAAIEAGRPDRLDIDLRGLQDYTEDGARSLAACRTLGNQLGEGLHYRTGRGPGREALLVAYQDADTPGEPEALGDPG